MEFVLLALIILFSYTIQAMTGFGSIILAVTFGSLFYPIKTILPVLVLLDLLLNIYIVAKHGEFVDFDLLFRRILPLMIAGAVVGFEIFKSYAGDSRVLLGILVVGLATFELVNFRKGVPAAKRQAPPLLFLAGVVEGMYASGGPLVVYVLNKLNKSKSTFRSTLSLLWIIMDILLLGGYVFIHILDVSVAFKTAILLPVVALSLFFGEQLHRRVDEVKFKLIVLYILLVGGISIILGR